MTESSVAGRFNEEKLNNTSGRLPMKGLLRQERYEVRSTVLFSVGF